MKWCTDQKYESRPRTFEKLVKQDGWKFKLYSIRHPSVSVDWDVYSIGVDLAISTLPKPARDKQRPGVGFMIAHRGLNQSYLVTCYWDNCNELPVRVFVNKTGEADGWRLADEHESICVWDIEIIKFERDAYIKSILSHPEAPDLEAYLKDRCTPQS